MNKPSDKQFFLEKRLLWMSQPEAAPAPEPTAPATIEKKEQLAQIEYKEKISEGEIDSIADRVRDLNVGQQDILQPSDRGPANLLKFRQALNKALEGQKEQIKVEHLDLFLLNGLLENLGQADVKVTEVWPREAQALNKFLRDKQVAKFSIEAGFWKFFDKDGKAVKADYALDGSTDNVEQVVLGKKVQEAKNRDKAAKEKQAADDKAEAERVKPENLEKVSSVPGKAVALSVHLKLEDFAKELEKTVTPEVSAGVPAAKPAIKVEEIKAALSGYLESYGQGDAEKNFAAFLEDIMKQVFTECRIQNGRIAFSKDGQKFTSNPLGLEQGGQKVVLYAHPKLGRVRAEEAQKKAAEKVEAGKPLQTPYDVAEQEAIKIITGKEKPDERDVNNANIDARYLPAIKSILAYPLNGRPVDVKIPFNDFNPLNCKFYAASDGSYVLSWDNGKGFSRYMPTVKGEPGLKEAQKYFVANLNNGWIFKEVQRMNILDKTRLAHWGQEIDDGPKQMPDGGIYYEFDWKGRDPDVTIYAERHGVLRVVVEKSGIALDGGKRYEFRAAGFQDMMRTFKRLQRWVESDSINKGKLRQGEEDSRFFEQVVDGARDYRAEAQRRGAGKLLSVTSVNNMNPDGTFDRGAFDRGHYLEFDWMQKMVPAQRMQIFRNGVGNFEFYLMPRRQKLGEMGPQVTARDAMANALVLAAEQRQLLTTRGGEVLRQRAFTEVLEAINKIEVPIPTESAKPPKIDKIRERPFVLMEGVTVTAASAASGDFYLSRGDGMAPVRFHLGTVDRPNFAQFQRAEKQGYLARIPKASPETVTTPETPPPAPKTQVKVSLASPAELSKRISHAAERSQAINEVCGRIGKNTANYDRVVRYATLRLAAFEPPAGMTDKELLKQQFIGELWKILSELSGVDGAYRTDSKTQNEIIAKLKHFNTKDELDKKSVIPGQLGLSALPLTRMYLQGLFDSLEKDIHVSAEGEALADLKTKAVQEYRQAVLAEMNKIMTKTQKGKYELPFQYDKRIYNVALLQIKLPREFLKEFQDNEAVRKKHQEWQDKQKQKADKQKEDQDRLNKPHLMSLEEMDKKPVAGMVGEARRMFETVKTLQRAEIFMSRIDGNGLMEQNNSYFNVRAGKVPNQMPMTLRFFREGGELRVSAVDGWNNNSEAPRRDWVGAGGEAGAKAVDLAVARAMAHHEGLNTDTMLLPSAPAASTAAQPAAAPPAAK